MTVFKWTDDLRAMAIETYRDRMDEISEEDRPKHTQEVTNSIATEIGCTPNSLRTILQKAKQPDGTSVYISKAATKAKASPKGEGTKRRGKAESHADLIAAITSMAGESSVDMEVIDKLTGKAADYITSVLVAISEAEAE